MAEAEKTVCVIDEATIDFQSQIPENTVPFNLDLRSRLEQGDLEGYELIDGLVFHKNAVRAKQLVVPTEMIENVIRTLHVKIGHLGVDKCCSEIKKTLLVHSKEKSCSKFY